MQLTHDRSNSWGDSESGTSSALRLRPTPKATPIWLRAIRSVKHHGFAAAVAILVVLGIAGVYIIRLRPSYSATSLVYVSPTFPKTLKEDSETTYPYDSYIQQQVHTVTRYDVLRDAIRSLPSGVWKNPNESESAAVARLQRLLTVNRIEPTYQISIMLQGGNPSHLDQVVNAITQSYIAKAKDEEFYGRDDRLTTLRDLRTQLHGQLHEDLQEQADITRELGVAVLNSADTADPYDDQLSRVRADLQAAREQRIEAEAKLASLKSTDTSVPNVILDNEADAAIVNDPQLAAVKMALGQKKSLLMTQAAGLTESNPVRKQAEADIAQIDSGLKEMSDDIRRKVGTQLEDRSHANVIRAGLVEAELQHQLQLDAAAADSAAPRFQRAEQFKSEIDDLENRYKQVDDRIASLELESSSPGTVHLFSPAMQPLQPEPQKIKTVFPLILPFAVLIALSVSMLMDYFDPRVYVEQDLESVLGFAPIGGLFADNQVTQLLFDEYVLRLAAAVDHATRTAGARTYVMTAADSETETAPVVENLAHALAALGRRVITIAATGNSDPVAYASIEFDQEVRAGHGLTVAPAQQSIIRSHAPSGQAMRSAVGPLPSFANHAFQKLTSDYEIVLIDAAPLLSSGDTEYLARCADVTVLIATAGKTTKARLTRSAQLLERLDVAGVAAVICEISPDRVYGFTKEDLRDFEARTENAGLHWRPRVAPFVVTGTCFTGQTEAPRTTNEPAVGVG